MATRNKGVLRREWRRYFPTHIWYQIVELDREHKSLCEQFIECVRQFAFVDPEQRQDAEDDIDQGFDQLMEEWRGVAPVELQLERGVAIVENMWDQRYEYYRMWAENVEERLGRMRMGVPQRLR
jgi:hypothetical protein